MYRLTKLQKMKQWDSCIDKNSLFDDKNTSMIIKKLVQLYIAFPIGARDCYIRYDNRTELLDLSDRIQHKRIMQARYVSMLPVTLINDTSDIEWKKFINYLKNMYKGGNDETYKETN